MAWSQLVANKTLVFVSCLLGLASLPSHAAYSGSELRSVQTAREAEVRDLREKEIEQLRVTLGRRPENARRADLYFRLAELFLEAYQHEFILEGRVYDRKLNQGGQALRAAKAQGMDRGASHKYLERGIAVCKELLALKIPYAKMDAVYYFLGFNYSELGKTKESVFYFKKLVDTFPQSAFVSEATREIGEAEFKAGRYESALAYYQRAVSASGKNAELLPTIYHRLAWAYYRTRQYDRAVDMMKTAVVQIQKSGGEGKFVALKEEALRDMALFLSEAGRPEEGVRYFKQVASSQTDLVQALLILAREFEKSLRYEQALEVYQSLLKQSLSAEVDYQIRGKVIDVNLKRGRAMDALAWIAAMPEQAPGDPKTAEGTEALAIHQNLPNKVRRTATEKHEAARKLEAGAAAARTDALKTAEAYYELYLKRFLVSRDSKREGPEIKMYLAEVKTDLGKWDEAGALYQDVMASGDARYRKEASALWAESLNRRLAVRKSQGLAAADRPSDLEWEFVKASDQLGREVPNSHEARESALRSAQILAGYSKTSDDGLERARAIVKAAPASPQAVVAAKLWLQGLRDRAERTGEFGPVESAVSELRTNREFRSSKEGQAFAQELGPLADSLRASQIKQLEKSGRLEDAARESLRLSKDSPDPKTRETAFLAALDQTVRLGKTREAVSLVLDRVKSAPRETRDQQARTAAMARAFASRLFIDGEFEASAELFRDLSDLWKDAALGQTAFGIWKSLGKTAEAMSAGRAALAHAGQTDLHWRLLAEMALLSPEHWAECATGPEPFGSECAARAGDAKVAQGQSAEAQKWYARAAAAGAKSPWAGYGLFQAVRAREEAQVFAKLTFSQTELQHALESRLKFFEDLNRQYARVVELGGPWAVAALDRVAAWTMNFTNELSRLEFPSDLSEADRLQARKTLAGVIQPLTKQATQTWTQAYERASKNEVLSPALVDVTHRLAEMGLRRGGFAQAPRHAFRLAGRGVSDGEGLRKLRGQLQTASQDGSLWLDYGNALWAEGRPGLARIAYDRALALNSRDAAALSNRAIVLLMERGAEDWATAAQAQSALKQAQAGAAAGSATAQAVVQNLGALLAYYRLSERAMGYFDKLNVSAADVAALDAMAAASFGAGQARRAGDLLDRADGRPGANKKRFGRLYGRAALARARGNADGVKECLNVLDDLEMDSLHGFEKTAAGLLKTACGGK